MALKDEVEKIKLRLDILDKMFQALDREISIIHEKLKLKDDLDMQHSNAIQNVQLEYLLARAAIVEFIERYSHEDEDISIEDLIRQYSKHLYILKDKRAKFGEAHCPVWIITEITEIERKLDELYEQRAHTKNN